MRNVLPELVTWLDAGAPVALATVVGTWDSAPSAPGAAMVVGPDGSAVGSVSGGCVESDVYALAEQVLVDGRPVLQRYGGVDMDSDAVGLPCGGTIEVFVERVTRSSFPQLSGVADDAAASRPVAVATVVEHVDRTRVGLRLVVRDGAQPAEGSLGSDPLDTAVAADARGLLLAGASGALTYGVDGERLGSELRVFVSSLAPKPRMLLFGATDFTVALARLGTTLGYRVTVCDARPVFTTAARFPGADVVVDWPHRYLSAEVHAGRVDATTALCVLTHDHKFDVPLLEVALSLPALGYLGALGSRRTVADRHRRLRDSGVTEEQLARLASPMGLDLGAQTPEETAVSIVAEIIGQRRGSRGWSRGRRLADLEGRIHH